MASNSILKLQVDDKQYEASLKSAQQGLKALQDALRNSGKSFADVDKQTEEYVRALGKMGTTAKTARGGIGEMSSAFVELSRIEKQLTDQERQSPVGKALTESLGQLKQRTIEAKQELEDLDKQLTSQKAPATTGGMFSGIGSKMEGALAVFGGNLMTKAAGAVASLGSEMADMVKQGVELAKQGEGIRIAFERLGRGEILQGLREATHGTVTDLELMKAAVKFNDFKLPLDELGTMLAFAQQKAKDTGQSVDYMVDSIVTGLGRKSLMILDNLGLSATEVKGKMKETGDMTKAVGAIIREQMSKAGDYMETAADRAAQANVSLQNKMEELGRKFAPLEEASNNFWTSMKIGILDVIGGPLTDLLNKLTQAGRMANAYGLMGGNTKVGRMTSNLAGASEGNRQSIYQQQQEQFWRYINPREQQIKDIRAWQSGERNEALQKRIGAITDKYGSLDATKIQAEVDAAKKMLSDYQAAAKQILQPIKQKIVPTVGDGGNSGGGGGRSGGGGDTKQQLTEYQENQKKINELAQEYSENMDKIAKAGNPISQEQKKRLEATKNQNIEIQEQIQLLEKRNGLLKYYEAKARGLYQPQQGDFDKNVGKFEMNPFAADDKAIQMTGSLHLQLDEESMKAVQSQIGKSLAKDGLTASEAWSKASRSISAVSSALSSVENPATKIMGTIGQAIATIALAYAETLAKDKSSKSNIWYFIGTAAAAMISMATTISSIHSSTGYAQGGIVDGRGGGFVGGTAYSGDNIGNVRLDSGELVLNKSQQANLASQLRDSHQQPMRIVGVVKGENIALMLDNYGKASGRGELAFWK
jgi:hypothetical protein